MLRVFMAALASVVFLIGTANAGLILTANLTHDQEFVTGTFVTSTGAPRPESFGTAIFELNDAMTAMTMVATVFNIDVTGLQTPNDTNDNLTAAHIHASSAVLADPTATRPVVWGFFGLPFNNTNPDEGTVTPFASGVGGVFTATWNELEGNAGTTLTAQLPNILAGRSYINFHTRQFGGGEIRGQILPTPEPASLALLAIGGVGLAGAALRRRRTA